MRIAPWLLLPLSMAISACDLAPKYEVPDTQTPAAYKEAGPWQPAQPQDGAPRGPWWTQFHDATLDALEPQLDAANQDLAAAAARYDEARAYAAEAEAGAYPQVAAGAGLSTNKQSAQRPLRSADSPNYYGANQLDLQASYEIDLWGKIRNEGVAGRAMAQASAADLAAVRLSLEAELANDYFALRGFDAQADLLAQTVTAYRKALDLTQALYTGKLVSSMDVSRAQTQLATAQAQDSDTAAKRALMEHAIAALINKTPSDFSLPAAVVPLEPPAVPVIMPSTLLQRRPDIAESERNVAAANAGIGIAKAAFYPSLSFNFLGGSQSTNLNLLSASNIFWALGPSVSLPLFTGGALEAQESSAYARFRETSATYRSTVIHAFTEVEDNLALLRLLAQESQHEQVAVTSAQHTLDVAMNLYKEGADSYLEVVTAQTPLLMAQQSAIDIQTRRVQAAVGLVRAFGGGWSVADMPSDVQASTLAANKM